MQFDYYCYYYYLWKRRQKASASATGSKKRWDKASGRDTETLWADVQGSNRQPSTNELQVEYQRKWIRRRNGPARRTWKLWISLKRTVPLSINVPASLVKYRPRLETAKTTIHTKLKWLKVGSEQEATRGFRSTCDTCASHLLHIYVKHVKCL